MTRACACRIAFASATRPGLHVPQRRADRCDRGRRERRGVWLHGLVDDRGAAIGAGPDRRWPARSGRPARDGLRPRPQDHLNARLRRPRAAVGRRLGTVGARQRRRLPPASRRRETHQGHLGGQRSARAAVARQPPVCCVARPGRRLQRTARQPLHPPPPDHRRPGAKRREQQPRARARRPDGHGRHRVVRPLSSRVALLRRCRVVQHRRQRSAGRRRAHPRAGRPRVLPGHRHAVHDDEPARRPRRAHARRLAGHRPSGTGLGVAGLLRTGRRRVRRGPGPDELARSRTRRRVASRSSPGSSVPASARRRSSPSGRRRSSDGSG